MFTGGVVVGGDVGTVGDVGGVVTGSVVAALVGGIVEGAGATVVVTPWGTVVDPPALMVVVVVT